MSLAFGNVVHPPFIDRLIPDAQTGAWDNLGPRKPVGVCQHSMVGSLWGTDGWFRRGIAVSNGLTDYGIGGTTDGPQWDGVILRWNDPLGGAQPGISPHRAGWANGGSDGLEGDGPLFVRTLGINAINRDLVSIERSDGGDISTPVSPKQFESICALTAYWFDWARVPWDRFPLNPAHNLVTHFLHFEFATKACPFPPVTTRIDEIQERVRAILKAGQTLGISSPVEEHPRPPTPDHHAWPRDWDEAKLAKRWGSVRQVEPGGTIKQFGWNPTHPVCNAWVARAAADDRRPHESDLPRPLIWQRIRGDDTQVSDLIMFAGSPSRQWALYRPAPHIRWTWAN
ncbi:MAG TPA: hypothetical protein VFL82_14110 [Thermomicrobiales bacterium]|nr:hypothetical protein [Thermomicrobiales bacterium]